MLRGISSHGSCPEMTGVDYNKREKERSREKRREISSRFISARVRESH